MHLPAIRGQKDGEREVVEGLREREAPLLNKPDHVSEPEYKQAASLFIVRDDGRFKHHTCTRG